MINKKILLMKLREFTINYEIKLGKSKEEQEAFNERVNLLEKQLNEQRFTDADFVEAIDNIMKKNATMYGKTFPNLAMFLENSEHKTITQDDEVKIKVSKIMNWLTDQSYTSAYGEEVWSYAEYDKEFTDESINILIKAEFGGIRELIEDYRLKKAKGYTGFFRKELTEMFKTQDLKAQKLRIENSKRGELLGITEQLGKQIRYDDKINSKEVNLN